MKAAVFAVLISLVIPTYSWADGLEKDPPATPEHTEDGGDAGVDETALRARTSDNFNEATRKIKEMVESETKVFTKLAAEYAARIIKGMDDGTAEHALSQMMTEHDSWGEAEETAYFVDKDENGEEINRFKKLSPNERLLISLDYLKARQKLRALLHDKVAEALKDSKDSRIKAIYPQLAGLKKINLDAWDLAPHEVRAKFKKNGDTAPICFTCGENVSVDTDYNFGGLMGEAAEKAMVDAKLTDGEMNRKAYFKVGGFSRTKGGKLVETLIDGNGALLGSTGVNSREDQAKAGSDRDLVAAARKYYTDRLAAKDYKMDKLFPGNVAAQNQVKSFIKWADDKVLSQPDPKAPVLAAVGGVAPPKPKASLENYLGTVTGHPTPQAYPTPEKMAEAIGLVDEKGEAYVKHIENSHQDRTGRYGVEILWDKIRYAAPAERARVMGILRTINSETGPARYKVDNGNNGYCIWCNLHNRKEAGEALAEIK